MRRAGGGGLCNLWKAVEIELQEKWRRWDRLCRMYVLSSVHAGFDGFSHLARVFRRGHLRDVSAWVITIKHA